MRSIDPTQASYNDSTELTNGPFQGNSICDICSSEDGMGHLREIAQDPRPDGFSPRQQFAVQRFLMRQISLVTE